MKNVPRAGPGPSFPSPHRGAILRAAARHAQAGGGRHTVRSWLPLFSMRWIWSNSHFYAVGRASQTLKNLRWFEIVSTRGQIENGKPTHYQVILKVGFTLEE
jgi:flavin-binding protein dodecin